MDEKLATIKKSLEDEAVRLLSGDDSPALPAFHKEEAAKVIIADDPLCLWWLIEQLEKAWQDVAWLEARNTDVFKIVEETDSFANNIQLDILQLRRRLRKSR